MARRITRQLTEGLAGKAAGVNSALEQLEPRLVLAGTPLPTLASLENPGNAVIRMETTSGDIDVELFTTDSRITITTDNFLRYVTSGRIDETFIHRSETNFVLQGGGFSYTDAGGLREVSADPGIVLQAVRSNLARTLSMARTNDPNSGTSQFFINLVDNFSLDAGANGDQSALGYAVFGRVIQGWNSVQAISQLQVPNSATQNSPGLSNDPAFAGPLSSNFRRTPVNATYNASVGVRERDLVGLVNVEVIKPAGAFQFYADEVVYPEGFRSRFSTETVDLVNTNPVAASYQIIARYENGQRDTVIASGSIPAATSREIKVWDPANASQSALRADTPYALVVQTAISTATGAPSTPTPIGASFLRTDFGGAVGDAFFNARGISSTDLRTWDFPRIERNDLSREFITWANLSDQTATVNVSFYDSNGISSVSRQFQLKPYRRGGIAVASVGLPAGTYAARVTSDQAIAAAFSDFDLPQNPPGGPTVPPGPAFTPAFGGLGQPGGNITRAALSGAEFLADHSSVLSIFNPSLTPAVVTLSFWRTSRPLNVDPITRFQIVAAQRRVDFDLSSLATDGVAPGEEVAITYSSGATPIALSYLSVPSIVRGLNALPADGVYSEFATRTGNTALFGDARTDPALTSGGETQTLSLWNPFSAAGVTYSYAVSILFDDGTELGISSGSLIPNGRIDVNLSGNAQIRAKAASDSTGRFQHYAVVVSGIASGGGLGSNVSMAPFALLVRRDNANGRSIAALPTLGGGFTALSNPIFSTNPGVGS